MIETVKFTTKVPIEMSATLNVPSAAAVAGAAPCPPLLQAEYFRLSKKSGHRLMASPSFQHFRKPHMTHLHAVIEFKHAEGEPICSFIQRGSQFRFYRGYPNWNDWMRQTPTAPPRT